MTEKWEGSVTKVKCSLSPTIGLFTLRTHRVMCSAYSFYVVTSYAQSLYFHIPVLIG